MAQVSVWAGNLQDSLENILLCFGIGLGALGFIFYILFFLGIGFKSIIILVLGSLLILNKNTLYTDLQKIKEKYVKASPQIIIFWSLIIGFFVIYSSAPIDRYDALSKHLPITLYAARTGKFYINVIESNVYGEPMVMQYDFSAVFAILGAEKALTLFNVILLFATGFGSWCAFQRLSENLNINFFIIGLISIPIFFELGTIFYIDIMPIFFLVAVLAQIITFSAQESWEKIIAISFCLGCAFFCKLTSSYGILILGLVTFACSLRFVFDRKINYKSCLIKYGLSVGMFLLPFIVSILYFWYMTGNPFFFFYNSIFKSPYFYQNNFKDPFINPLGVNFQTLINMVFHTSLNVEMKDGGLGSFLLGIVLVPICIALKRDKKVIVWGILSIILHQISCLFTYNLRYMLLTYILIWGLVCISIFELKNFLPQNCQKFLLVLMGIIFILPNCVYIYHNENINQKLKVDERLCDNANASVLSEVPNGKRIFAINDCFKGDYEGFYNSFTWHNSVYNTANLLEGNISYEDYLKSFDYVLYDKRNEIPTAELRNILKNENVLKFVLESNSHVLYEVVLDKNESVVKNLFETPVESEVSNPLTTTFEADKGTYYIEQDIENPNDYDVEMRFQINWLDKNNELINTTLYTYTLPRKTRLNKRSIGLISPPNAAIGQLYITSHTDNIVKVYGYQLEVQKDNDYITSETNKFYSRELLQDNNETRGTLGRGNVLFPISL